MAKFPFEAHGKGYACGIERIMPFPPNTHRRSSVAMDISSTYLLVLKGLAQKRSTSVPFPFSHEMLSLIGSQDAPPFSPALLAGVHVIHRFAATAANVTAPNELALAAFDVSYHVCIVAPATAQQVAAVRPG